MAAARSGDLTFLLIHGGGSTGRFWDRLLPHLDRPSLAVDLPGRDGTDEELAELTVQDEVAGVLAQVDARPDLADGRWIVVAHSSGGLVVPGVVAGLAGRVAHIVLNAALVPVEGGCGADCMKPHHRDGLVAALEMARADGTVITLPGAPADPEPFRTATGGDPLDDEALAFVTDPLRCVRDTVHHYFQPVHWSAAAGVPVTYVVNDRDRPITPAMQAEMLTRLPTTPTVVHLDGGHLPAVTDPTAFAAILRRVADEVG